MKITVAQQEQYAPEKSLGWQGSTKSDLAHRLHSQGVRPGYVDALISNISSHCSDQNPERALVEALSKAITFQSRLSPSQRVVALIGPRGAGKTTSIAKLAARTRLVFNARVGLISADACRVGAGVHLKTYASLMRLPFQIASKGAELRMAIEALPDCDLIFVDTAGCSAREVGRLKELRHTLNCGIALQRLLVISACGSDADLQDVAAAYESVEYDRLLLSKIDETSFVGPALNTILQTAKPLSFLTMGRRVPEDIEPATARRFGLMLTRPVH